MPLVDRATPGTPLQTESRVAWLLRQYNAYVRDPDIERIDAMRPGRSVVKLRGRKYPVERLAFAETNRHRALCRTTESDSATTERCCGGGAA